MTFTLQRETAATEPGYTAPVLSGVPGSRGGLAAAREAAPRRPAPGAAPQSSRALASDQPAAPGSRGARVYSLTAARQRRAIVGAARELLAVADYRDVDFEAVAQAAHVSPADVRRAFPTRMALTVAAMKLPPVAVGADLVRLGGAGVVRRFLSFCERGENAAILLNVLRAAVRDPRVVRDVEDYVSGSLLGPLAGVLGTPDACPRVRLLVSALLGLSVSRYLLREEPLASADHDTVAAWMGPSLDCYLRGRLGTS